MNTELDISVVIPVYNEAGNVIPLYEDICEIFEKLNPSFEIIFVDDCSTDATLSELKTLKSNIKIITLEKNSGQSAAFSAGFKEAKGGLVVTLDGDRQNDPKDIPLLLKTLKEENLDMVCGWRKSRKDTWRIRIASHLGRLARIVLFGDTIHDSGCSLRVYKKKVVQNLKLTGKMHRYMVLLIRQNGYRIGEVVVRHHARTIGKSKYSASKVWEGLIQLLKLRFGTDIFLIILYTSLTVSLSIIIYSLCYL